MAEQRESGLGRRPLFTSMALAGAIFVPAGLVLQSPAGVLAAALMGLAVGGVYFQGSLTLVIIRSTEEADAHADHDRARQGAYQAARGAINLVPIGYPHADAPSLETALFVLEEAKTGFERQDRGSDNIEAKATTLITIVAGASSALGVFGISREGRAIVATPLILFAFLFTAVALACLLYVVRSKKFSTPDVEPFISPGIVSEDNRVGIALLLARDYRVSTDSLRRAIRYEPLALFVAYVAIATAAGLVLLNAATSIPWWNGNVVPSASPSPATSASARPGSPVPTAAARPSAPPASPGPQGSRPPSMHPGGQPPATGPTVAAPRNSPSP